MTSILKDANEQTLITSIWSNYVSSHNNYSY
jgi:hypothetical protein